jgi:outer membrane receptor for ferrienterochelin and colicins
LFILNPCPETTALLSVGLYAMNRLLIWIWTALVIGAAGMAFAEASGPAAGDGAALDRLTRDMDQLTEIATRTRMNADFVPGMVTVFYGDDLEARGIRTVGEALTLVPGIHLAHISPSFGRTAVRGVSRGFASGHLKVLLNGIPLTTAFGIDPVPNMPVGQVARIEVVRGPGSAIHGEYAFAGVMNIITRRSGRRAFAGVGRDETLLAGGTVSAGGDPDRPLLGLNAAWATAGASAEVAGAYRESGSVSTSGDPAPVFGAPTDTYTEGDTSGGFGGYIGADALPTAGDRSYASGILTFERGPWSASGYLFQNDQDALYTGRQWGLSGTRRWDFVPGLEASLRLGLRGRRFDNEAAPETDWSGVDPEAEIFGYDYDESILDAELEAVYRGWAGHTLLGIAGFSELRLDDVVPPDNGPGGRLEGRDRRHGSLAIQDEIAFHDRLQVTAGLRYDTYDDVGDQISPRIAAVFRLNQNRGAAVRHILKTQYGRAFRPPSFLEMVANANEDPITESETVDTVELGYIRRSTALLCRLTLFHSEMAARAGYAGPASGVIDGRSRGAEMELTARLPGTRIEVEGTLSRSWTDWSLAADEVPETADWLGSLGVLFEPTSWLSLSSRCRWAGDRGGGLDDTLTVDLTAGLAPFQNRDIRLRAGVKNLFAEDFRYPITGDPADGEAPLTWAGEAPDRWWWATFTVSF